MQSDSKIDQLVGSLSRMPAEFLNRGARKRTIVGIAARSDVLIDLGIA